MEKIKMLQEITLTASPFMLTVLNASPFMLSEIKKSLDISENSTDEEYARQKNKIEELRKFIKEVEDKKCAADD